MPKRHTGEVAAQRRNELGKRLEAIRADMGLSQGEFAKQLDTVQQTYSAQIMREEPSPWFAANVRERFGIEIEAGHVEDREERMAVRVATLVLSGDPRSLERVLLEALAEHYQEPAFLAGRYPDVTALPAGAAKPVVIRHVQSVETRMRERRQAAGESLPPPLLLSYFVTGE